MTTLIDEPTGAGPHEKRMEMANKAKEDGSEEMELVMKIDDFKNGKYEEVASDLKELCKILPTKVIIGSGYLTDEEIKKASEMVSDSGAICVKTATSADPLDNSELDEKAKHIRIMRSSVPESFLVKASGSIRSLSDVKMMVEAGADIIGTSSGVEIVMKQMVRIKDNRGVENNGVAYYRFEKLIFSYKLIVISYLCINPQLDWKFI